MTTFRTILLILIAQVFISSCSDCEKNSPQNNPKNHIGDSAHVVGRLAELIDLEDVFYDQNNRVREILKRSTDDRGLWELIDSVNSVGKKVKSLIRGFSHELESMIPPLFGGRDVPQKYFINDPGIFNSTDYWAEKLGQGEENFTKVLSLKKELVDFREGVEKVLVKGCNYKFDRDSKFPPKDARKLEAIPYSSTDNDYNEKYKLKTWEDLLFQTNSVENILLYLGELILVVEIQENWMLNSVLHCKLGIN